MARKHLLMDPAWPQAVQALSLEERRLLVDLLLMAALMDTPVLPLTVDSITGMARDENERADMIGRFAELCRAQLVRELSAGVFEIAPGLWRLENAD